MVEILSIPSILGAILSLAAVPVRSGCGFRRELGIWGVPLQGRLNRGHVLVPAALEGLEVGAKGAAEGGQRALAWREICECGIGASKQVEECQELRGMLNAEIVNQRPSLGVKIAPVAAAVARVADEWFQRRRWLNSPPVGEARIIGAADACPAAATDDLELHGQTLLKPDGKGVMPGKESTIGDQQVNDLVCGGSLVDRSTFQVQQQLLAPDLALEPIDQGEGISPADRAGGFAGQRHA